MDLEANIVLDFADAIRSGLKYGKPRVLWAVGFEAPVAWLPRGPPSGGIRGFCELNPILDHAENRGRSLSVW
jgi:hypothetical protein